MHSFYINIGSLTNPVKGSGYIRVYPLTDDNGLSKKRDKKYFRVVRKEFKKDLDFKQDEYRALKSLKDSGEITIEMKVNYNNDQVWYGYLVLSGSWDEDEKKCSLETQTIDQYSEFEKNLDKEVNVAGYNGSVSLQYTAEIFDLALPCFTGSRGEAEFYYDPNGAISDNPLESHPDWGYYAENGEIDCGGGQKQYLYRTAILYFPADGFVQSEINSSQWLQASLVPVPVSVTINRTAKLFDVLEDAISKADPEITINESSYSNYISNRQTLRNLRIMDKSDAKRNDSPSAALFELISVKELMELYLEWFDLSYQIDKNKNFYLVRKAELEEKNYNDFPQYDLTTYKNKDWSVNQKTYNTNISEKPNKEVLKFEQCNRAWFDTSELVYDSYSKNSNIKDFARFNNNIDYIRFDIEEVADNGFCVLSCTDFGIVYKQSALNGTELTNGQMSAHLLFNNYKLENRPFNKAELDGYPLELTKENDKEIIYKNIPYYNIDIIDFNYYIKTNLGLAEPEELEINFNKDFSTLKLKL